MEPEAHDLGLAHDLPRLIGRRRALAVMGGGLAAAVLVACDARSIPGGASGSTPSSTTATTTTIGTAGSTCSTIPEETAGPFPGDGSNGPNVLSASGVVRSDIRSSFGTGSAVAGGVPLTVELTIVDTGDGCTPMPGAAVYLWHCDREGRYSLYDDSLTGENYLRGVQEAGADGKVRFSSIFPGAYSGRWPHIHFEVYPDLAEATRAGTPTTTSQLAFPEDICGRVYAAEGYGQSLGNMASLSLARDMVFREDLAAHQMAIITGDVPSGLVAALAVPV